MEYYGAFTYNIRKRTGEARRGAENQTIVLICEFSLTVIRGMGSENSKILRMKMLNLPTVSPRLPFLFFPFPHGNLLGLK